MLRFARRQLMWMLVMLFLLTGCEPLEDLGDAISDLLKSIPSPQVIFGSYANRTNASVLLGWFPISLGNGTLRGWSPDSEHAHSRPHPKADPNIYTNRHADSRDDNQPSALDPVILARNDEQGPDITSRLSKAR